MAGRVEDSQADLAEPDQPAFGQFDGGHRRRDLERGGERRRVLQPVAIEPMHGDLGSGVGRNRGVVADVIPVPVRGHDQLQGPLAFGQRLRDPGEARRRRVDRDGLA
jgi:hypothetical protein